MSKKLTRRALEAWLKDPHAGDWLWCGEVRGFGVHRTGSGQSSFIVQYRIGRGARARKRRVTLGRVFVLGVDQAREQAAEHIRAGWQSVDLVEDAQAKQAAQARKLDTVVVLCPAFLKVRATMLRPNTVKARQSLWDRWIIPTFGSRPPSEIKRREVALLMDDAEAVAGSSTADMVFSQLALFFDWFAARDDAFASPLIKSMKRHRQGEGARPLSDDELRTFWAACGNAGLAGQAAQFVLLTATRRTEGLSAQRIELSGDLWRIPAARYKTKRDHVVPLSQHAAAIVSALDAALSPYLFSMTNRPPHHSTTWERIVSAGGPKGRGLSWHSLRKTARTLMSRAGVRSEHAERCLGHVQGAVERAYDKHDYVAEKRAAFEALAAEIDRIVNNACGTNVVPLRAA